MNTNEPRGRPVQALTPFPASALHSQSGVSLPCPGPTPQSTARPSIHKALLEVASEGLALIALDLTVLDSPALQEVVHLCGVDGSCPLLILRRGLANPVVDVIGQVAACLVDSQDYVAVTIVEAAKGARRNRHHLHSLDPPYLHPGGGDVERAFDLGTQFGHGDEPGWRRRLPPGRSQGVVASWL